MPAKPSDMVGKALRLLQLLGDYPDGARVSELAERAGHPVSTTHRLLASLQREGFVRAAADRRYELGLRLFELGQQVSHRRGFAGVALPVMQQVSESTGEPTLFAVRDNQDMLYVHSVEGSHQVQIRGEPGRRGPLHCTSMGKCLVAFAADEERATLVDELPLTAHAPNTITERRRFAKEIESVRANGYAIADEEHELGILAIGVPVLDAAGTALGSLSAAAPAYRVTEAQLHAWLPALQAAARELSAALPRH